MLSRVWGSGVNLVSACFYGREMMSTGNAVKFKYYADVRM